MLASYPSWHEGRNDRSRGARAGGGGRLGRSARIPAPCCPTDGTYVGGGRGDSRAPGDRPSHRSRPRVGDRWADLESLLWRGSRYLARSAEKQEQFDSQIGEPSRLPVLSFGAQRGRWRLRRGARDAICPDVRSHPREPRRLRARSPSLGAGGDPPTCGARGLERARASARSRADAAGKRRASGPPECGAGRTCPVRPFRFHTPTPKRRRRATERGGNPFRRESRGSRAWPRGQSARLADRPSRSRGCAAAGCRRRAGDCGSAAYGLTRARVRGRSRRRDRPVSRTERKPPNERLRSCPNVALLG
jgi:hypothetical protein